MDTVTKEISLTFDEWETLKKALDYYEYAAREFTTMTDADEFWKEFILPVYEQMPEEVF